MAKCKECKKKPSISVLGLCGHCYRLHREKIDRKYRELVSETNRLLLIAPVVRDTAYGPHVVDSVSYGPLGFAMTAHPRGKALDEWNRRIFVVHLGVLEEIKKKAQESIL